MNEVQLLALADKARENAYAPYSGFKVGAALLDTSGNVWSGCNIENASFGVTNCAERTALFKAVSKGQRSFSAIAIVGHKDGEPEKLCAPCGVCRQALSEFCGPEMRIIMRDSDGSTVVRRLGSLLPETFSLENKQ